MTSKQVFAAVLVLILISAAVILGWRGWNHSPSVAVAIDRPDVLWTVGGSRPAVGAPKAPRPITVDYPEEGSIFPPEITPPTFLWHDGSAAA